MKSALHFIRLRHAPNESACLLVLYQCEAYADMTASGAWTRQMPCDFIEMNIAVRNLEEELQWTLQPDVQTSHASGFDYDFLVQIS